MTKLRELTLDELDFSEFVRAGDGVVWGQVTSEAIPLTSRLMAQRANIGRFSVFLGATFSGTIDPAQAEHVRFYGIGGIANNRKLDREGVLETVPAQLSILPQYIDQGLIASDVAIVQLAEDDDGNFRFAVGTDYIVAAACKARTVIGEVNAQAPRTAGPHTIPRDRLACIVRTDRPVLSIPATAAGTTEDHIAAFASDFIPDEATIQTGIGAVPEAIMARLSDRRDLGIHSGMIGDSVVDLVERGVITNARKPIDTGRIVTGMLAGTEKLYRFADRRPELQMHTINYTHGSAILAKLPRLVSINSAIEVDLTGQVNAEVANGRHIGAVGGAIDYVRAAHRSPGGCSIIALPSTAAEGTISRIVGALNGPVSTPRSDVDVIVTEFGAARLRGLSFRERAKAMIDIAHPAFREALSRTAYELFGRL